MNNFSLLPGLILAATGLACSAGAIDITKLPPPADKTGVTYDTDIKPIFQASCFRCHGEKQHRGGISLNTLDGVLNGGEDGPILKVGDSAHSQLVVAISQLDPKSAMPPKRRGRPPGGPGGPGEPGGHEGGERRPPGGPGEGGPGAGPHDFGTNGPAGEPRRRPQGPPAKPLTPEQVGLVRAWIDQGAK